MSSEQEKEFAVFGIINRKLRAGLIIGLLSLSITANVYLVVKIIGMQGDLYEKMLNRVDSQVDKKLDPTLNRMTKAIDRVDTAVDASRVAAKVADSAGRIILNNQIKK